MTDCAPLVIAHEQGLFESAGLNVELYREAGWATVREKIYLGELDAAQAPASMAFELSLGYSGLRRSCLTGFLTAHNGNAITLSNELWNLGVRNGDDLLQLIRAEKGRRFTFAGVLQYSSQNYLMRHWLLSHGIVPGKDVDLVIVPPPQVHESLRNGYIDGYCVAEPWSSLGLLKKVGWCATLTSDFAPMHPEKAFMVTRDFHDEDPERHLALLSALHQASVWCDEPHNREQLADVLAHPHYVGVNRKVLTNALTGPFQTGKGSSIDASDAIVFHHGDANRPTLQKASWILDQIDMHKLPGSQLRPTSEVTRQIFREDIYNALLTNLSALPTP